MSRRKAQMKTLGLKPGTRDAQWNSQKVSFQPENLLQYFHQHFGVDGDGKPTASQLVLGGNSEGEKAVAVAGDSEGREEESGNIMDFFNEELQEEMNSLLEVDPVAWNITWSSADGGWLVTAVDTVKMTTQITKYQNKTFFYVLQECEKISHRLHPFRISPEYAKTLQQNYGRRSGCNRQRRRPVRGGGAARRQETVTVGRQKMANLLELAIKNQGRVTHNQ